MAALLHIGVNPFLFFCGHRAAGACYDQDGRLIRHGCFFEQAKRADIVSLFEQDVFGGREACSLPIVEARFPMSFEKEHLFLPVLSHADQGSGQFHFRGRGDADCVAGAFKYSRVGSVDAVVLSDFRLPFRVDKLHGHLRAGLSITIEPFFIGLVARIFFSSEDGDEHFAREISQYAIGLRRKGEVLVLRQVPPDGVAGCEEIHDGENADEEEDHQQAVGPHTSGAAGGEGFQSAEMDDCKEEEAKEGRPFHKGHQPEFFRGETVADCSCQGQGHADYSQWNRFHTYFHLVESTTRWDKKSINASPLTKYTRSFVSTSPRTRWS